MSGTDIEWDAALAPAGTQRTRPDGGVEGYRADRTLPLRVELGRQLRRRRTLLTVALLAVLPWLLLLGFELGDDSPDRGMSEIATSSALNFTLFTLYVSTGVLLVVVVALFFGDTVVSEFSWASLKYLLTAPVPRTRLLRQKAAVATVLTGIAVLLLTGMAMLAGSLWFGPGDLLRLTGETLPWPVGLLGLAGALLYMAVQFSWVAGLALWLSVTSGTKLGAVGTAVLVSILSQVLDRLPALGPVRDYLPTHFAMAWSDLLAGGIDWTAMSFGTFSALAYATAFGLLAVWRFARKDITS